MEEIQKLYDVLVRDGYYTKTLDEFNVQFQDPTYQDKVFNAVSRDGLYTKNKESFLILEKLLILITEKDN